MKNETFIENTTATCTIQRSRKQPPFLQLAEARARRYPIRIAFPLRCRESCLTRRAMLAALREAELIVWMATGGDFLASEPVLD